MYSIKAAFNIQCTPDEVFKLILDSDSRFVWDFDLVKVQKDEKTSKMVVEYAGNYKESISIKYMAANDKIFLI